MTIDDIKNKIQDIEVALSSNPDPKTKKLLEQGLDTFQSLLLAEQKKSEEPTGNPGQLPQMNHPRQNVMINPTFEEPTGRPPTKEEMREWAKKEEQQSSIERILVATLEPSQVIQVPVVQITLRKEKIFERDGKRVKETFEVKEQMTQSEILTMLKTYFKTLVNSENWKAGRYTEGKSGNMGFNVFELFKGWNVIHKITSEGDEYPPVNEVYPGYRHTSQDQKVGAELLWRWASNDK
jgi:hypothetical protein